jgi:hypothetical protein
MFIPTPRTIRSFFYMVLSFHFESLSQKYWELSMRIEEAKAINIAITKKVHNKTKKPALRIVK